MLWISPSGSLYVNASGAPFDATAAELTACCCCKWYKIRTAYYDAACTDVAGGYNDTVTCECRCLISGNPPDPLPAGKTIFDYTGTYPLVNSEYRMDAFGPYDATCDLSADQVCAAAKIEGCDYAWGCSYDTEHDQPRMYYGIRLLYYSDQCVTLDYDYGNSILCYSAWELANREQPADGSCQPGQPSGYYYRYIVDGGPEFRRCDIPQP